MRYSTCTKGRPASAASWALRIFEAATICIALVICAVLLMERMRRRKSRGLFINQSSQVPDLASSNQNYQALMVRLSPCFLELVDGCLHLGSQGCTESFFSRNFAE